MAEKTRSKRKQMNRTTATTHLASPVKAKPKTVWDLSRCEFSFSLKDKSVNFVVGNFVV
jgi:hypothetical protein